MYQKAFRMFAFGSVLALNAVPASYAANCMPAKVCKPTVTVTHCPPVVYCPPVLIHHTTISATVPPKAPPADPQRQVRVTYFSTQFNAWFETDAMVAPSSATIGLSVSVVVPNVGSVRGWVVSVYKMPRTQSTYKHEVESAPQSVSMSNVGDGERKPEVAALAVGKPAKVSNREFGCTRLWTNKDGSKQITAELLSVDEKTIKVRTEDGRIVSQAIDSLSDADALFIKTSAWPVAVEALAAR